MAFFSVNAEFFDVRRKLLRIPVFVRSAEQRAHLCGAHRARETAVLEHHADFFTDGRIRAVFPQHGNLPLSGRMRSSTALMVVVFPAPFSPIKPITVPLGRVNPIAERNRRISCRRRAAPVHSLS